MSFIKNITPKFEKVFFLGVGASHASAGTPLGKDLVWSYYEDGELDEKATIKDFLIVRKEGSRQVKCKVEYYNLDMIIAVGYRIKSRIATHFRQWATRRLLEYIVKGFVLDDERLKNPDQPFDYFDELIRRIQDIRTSERRFYQKITLCYQCGL